MGSIDGPYSRQVRSVAIIGAGPSGLAAAKYLIAEQYFESIVIFEQRSNVGGLWNYTPYDRTKSTPVKAPNTNPFVSNEEPIKGSSGEFMSPVYDRLETNIPRGLMGFSDLDWPERSQLFPQHEVVLRYIEDYAKGIQDLIKFQTQVLDVQQRDSQWLVVVRDIRSSKHQTYSVHAVIVANGHFNVPFIPPVEGIETFQEAYPESILHSSTYRRPEDFANQKVVVVGNSASGVDIGAQIRQTCHKPMIQSSTSESYLSPDPSADQLEKPRIVRYEVEDRTIHFADGTQERKVDAVVYCTGYMYSFPFLESIKPPLISTGERVHGLYKHIFWARDPTLSFVVLIQKGIPFPIAEVQGAVIARVLSARLALPSVDDMRDWEEETLKSAPRVRDFHLIKFPRDYEYINELHDLATSVDHHASVGKTPPRWDNESYWTREKFPEIKKAFQRLGDARHETRTLRDVGFVYPGPIR